MLFKLASFIGLLMVSYAASSATPTEAVLPEPLTLEYALSLADANQPDLEQAIADQPSDLSIDRTHDDSSASLFARKRLYDFGRTSAAVDAASAEVSSQQWRVTDARDVRRIDIMARFFDVLLSDLRYARDYEAMSIAFVAYDHAVDRRKLGQLSDLDVAELHSRYQDVRRRWYESTAEQRNSRARLARALNWTGRLPAELTSPDLKTTATSAPDLEALQAQAVQSNPSILAARERVAALAQRVNSVRAGYWPTLDAEVELSAYARDMSGRDKVRAGVVLDIPLYSGGKISAEVAQQRAELRRVQAQLLARQQDVKIAIQELHGELGVLRIQREEAKALHDFRDLYLDRSRLQYEQEMRTDLGDAMTRQSEARLRDAETEFAIALTRARLEALVGKPLAAEKAGEKK
ncbi:MAG: TolC family protein [Gammaproteobacteria bacterium]|nr:TolC family protein [Gammaproteobacteria bacterium]